MVDSAKSHERLTWTAADPRPCSRPPHTVLREGKPPSKVSFGERHAIPSAQVGSRDTGRGCTHTPVDRQLRSPGPAAAVPWPVVMHCWLLSLLPRVPQSPQEKPSTTCFLPQLLEDAKNVSELQTRPSHT